MESKKLAMIAGLSIVSILLALILYNLQITGHQIIPEGGFSAEPAELSEPSKSYEDEILLYSIGLYYNSGELVEQGTRIIEGSAPNKGLEKFLDPEVAYTAKTISEDGEVLDISRFELGLFAFDFGAGELEETYLTLQLPYFPNGKLIEIYDSEAVLKLSIDVSTFSRPEVEKETKPMLTLRLAFDEEDLDGIQINDVSGNQNNGVLGNLESDPYPSCEAEKRLMKGVENQALFFDGVGDFVKVDDNQNFAADINDGLALLGWIYLVSAEGSGPQTIIAKPHEQDQLQPFKAAYSLLLVKDEKIPRLQFAAEGDGARVEIFSKNETPLNSWLFVAAVWDGEKARLYINGSLEDEKEFKGPIKISGENGLFIGGMPPSTTFNGLIDDIQIYKGRLSKEDLMAIFKQHEKADDLTKVYDIKERIHLFSFSEEDGILTDSITNDTQEAPQIKKILGQFGMAAGFNSSYIDVPLLLPDQNQFSVDLWFNLPKNISQQTILQLLGPKGGSGPPQSLIFANRTGIGIRSYQSSNYTGQNTTLEAFYQFAAGEYENISGGWSHLAAVLEFQKTSIYLNAQLKAELDSELQPDLNGSYIVIGGSSWSSLNKDYFGGLVDEVSVYDRPLGLAEIERLSKRMPEKTSKTLTVGEYLGSTEEYSCKSVSLQGTIKSKDACLECAGNVDECECQNKLITLADDAETAESEIQIKFFNGNQLYRSLEVGDRIIISVRQKEGELAYNFLEPYILLNNSTSFALAKDLH